MVSVCHVGNARVYSWCQSMKTFFGSVVVAWFAALLCAFPLQASPECSAPDGLLAIDADYYARLASSPSTVGDLLHEDFRYLTHYQTVLSKPRLLTYLQTRPALIERFSLGDRYLYSYGNGFLVWGLVQTQGQSEGFLSVVSQYWHVWECIETQWLLRTRQASLLE